MEPLTIQILAGMTVLTVATTVATIRYFIKKRLEKLDQIETDLVALKGEVATVSIQFDYIQDKINIMENTNFPLLIDIKNDISEMNKKLSVVENDVMYLKKHSDKHSSRLDSIDNHYHTHKRQDD